MDELIKALEKQGMDVKVASDVAKVEGWLHSGNYALNWAISGRFNRGYPLGHFVEFFGEASTGKSFFVARALSEMQNMGGSTVLDDPEGALSEAWIRKALRVDTDRLLYVRSDTVEEHSELVDRFIKAFDAQDDPKPLLIGLDSSSSLSTNHEMEHGLTKASMDKAKKLKKFCRVYAKSVHNRPIIYMFTNHVYDKIGASPWESKQVAHGGKAGKYESSIRVSMRTPKKIKKKRKVIGTIVRAVVEKTRFCVPFREVEIAIPAESPIEPTSGLIPVLIDLGVIGLSGHTITYKDEDTGIKAHKTSKLKQDASSKELLERFPDILEEADAMLDKKEDELYEVDLSDAEIED